MIRDPKILILDESVSKVQQPQKNSPAPSASSFFRALQKSGLNNNKLVTGNEAEALSSLSAAIMLQKKGNKEKARKLFRHAMALCPKHPKILNHYGEFLEALEGQILQVSQEKLVFAHFLVSLESPVYLLSESYCLFVIA